nr:uncharacterized protein LOC113729011 [Coffea arabica]
MKFPFRDFIVDGKWDSVGLAQYFPRDITTMILQHPTPEGESPDEVVWVSTTSGSFLLSSAFHEVRQARNPSWIFSHIWLPQLPLKVSFFMLRLLMRRLPLDDILGKLGFQLPSNCFCCSMAAGDSIEHIFSTGQIAAEIWGVFGSPCGICLPEVSLRERLVAWWMSGRSEPQRRFVVSILPSFIYWHVWKARNKAIFKGVKLTSGEICHGILRDISAAVEIKFQHGIVAQTFEQFFYRLSQSPPICRVHLVKWQAAGRGTFTLNTDGCSKGNPGMSGGVGILRDSNGPVLVAFSVSLGINTSLRAEALALLMGIRLYFQQGFEQVRVQTDSLVLVGILQQRFQCPWHIRREVRQIWRLVTDPTQVSHCFREANKVADILAPKQ